ncbi:FAD-dependent oxidoreductase [Sphingobium sp. ZW T5_29]|uniref:FAD-dependent oxidoreductase n=1 Tax=Sphingobium sp. ZW T5_29 TaxID=3378077 RepID=UPI0038531B1E
MKIEAAKTLNEVEFAATADVIIVGLGGAGASAAIAAAEAGADVLVIERTSGGGGSTAMSGGFIYLGGGTPPQKANGFADTPENMARFLKATQPKAAMDKIDAYCVGSVGHYDWLMSLGVTFNERYFDGKHFHPHSDETLVWTGSEACWPLSEAAEPIPRGHKPGGGFVGHLLFSRLLYRIEGLGIRIIYDAAVNALVSDASGAVAGVQYRQEGRNLAVAARKGVVLATGGCEWNRELGLAHGSKGVRDGVAPLGVPTADGAGIELGQSLGAAITGLEHSMVTSPFYPPASLVKGILVNSEGRRFVAEDVYHAWSTDAILNQPDGKAYLICDNVNFGRPELGDIRSERKHEVVDAWDNIPEMEADLGMPEGSLVETIGNYNRYAATGHDEEFRKNPKWLAPISEIPFAAIDCSVGSAYFCCISLGGIHTDVDGRALKPDGTPVPGLYAVGQVAPNLSVEGWGYASGLLIGGATFFGRRAGNAAAADTVRDGLGAGPGCPEIPADAA